MKPTKEEMDAVFLELAEPVPGERRDALAKHLAAGGALKARITEKGLRDKALLGHRAMHACDGRSCDDRRKLEEEAAALTGPAFEYVMVSAEEERADTERGALNVLWVEIALRSMTKKGYIDLPDGFPLKTNARGRRKLRGAIDAGWRPDRGDVMGVLSFFFGEKVSEDDLATIHALVMAEPVIAMLSR